MIRVPAIVVVVLCAIASPVSAQTARLIVSVNNESGEPIPDARIQLFRPTPRSETPTLISTYVTDALGVVEISVDAFSPYELRVTHKEIKASEFQTNHEFIWPFEGDVHISFWVSRHVDIIADDFDDVPRPIVVKGSLVGQVVSTTGEALPNIPLTVQGEGGGRIAHTLTDGSGSYAFALEPDTYRITAGEYLVVPHSERSSQTYTAYTRNEQTRVPVTSRRRTRANIALSPVQLFNVTVIVNDDQGQRVRNADVFSFSQAFRGHVQTGEDGWAMIGPNSRGPVELLVYATKDGRHFTGRATVDIQNSPLRVTMTLIPSGVITGRVEFVGRVDPLHGSMGLHVTHTVSGEPTLLPTNMDRSGRVEANGEFVVMHLLGEECLGLMGIPDGWQLRDITHQGRDYTHRPFSLQSGQTIEDVVIRIEPGAGGWRIPPRGCSQ